MTEFPSISCWVSITNVRNRYFETLTLNKEVENEDIKFQTNLMISLLPSFVMATYHSP